MAEGFGAHPPPGPRGCPTPGRPARPARAVDMDRQGWQGQYPASLWDRWGAHISHAVRVHAAKREAEEDSDDATGEVQGD